MMYPQKFTTYTSFMLYFSVGNNADKARGSKTLVQVRLISAPTRRGHSATEYFGRAVLFPTGYAGKDQTQP